MPKRFKWFLALLIVAGAAIVAQAALQSTAYLPIISRQLPTETLTPTITLTPTVTNTGTLTITATRTPTGTIHTSTPTSTLTPTPTLVPGVFIISIDYAPTGTPLDEYVNLRNQAGPGPGAYVDMTGWTLQDDSSGPNKNIFTFPQFTLTDFAFVKVWTKAGQIDPGNLYWGRTEEVWNDFGDCAYLRDDENKLIDSLCYGSTGIFFRP